MRTLRLRDVTNRFLGFFYKLRKNFLEHLFNFFWIFLFICFFSQDNVIYWPHIYWYNHRLQLCESCQVLFYYFIGNNSFTDGGLNFKYVIHPFRLTEPPSNKSTSRTVRRHDHDKNVNGAGRWERHGIFGTVISQLKSHSYHVNSLIKNKIKI